MLEELIYRQLSELDSFTALLGSYDGKSALFYQKAPRDEDPLWEKPAFPRVEFFLDRRGDGERSSGGKLTFHIWTNSDCLSASGGSLDREIEIVLLENIGGTFYTENGLSYSPCWVDSLTFLGNISQRNMEASAVETYGITVVFELVAFLTQVTTVPDPVSGLNCWTKKLFPDLKVVGVDPLSEVTLPSDEVPLIYWRFSGFVGEIPPTYSVQWYDTQIFLHVFAGSVPCRNGWVKAIFEKLQEEGEILLSDDSPLWIGKVQVLHDGHPLKQGQGKLLGRYGVLVSERRARAVEKLKNVSFSS